MKIPTLETLTRPRPQWMVIVAFVLGGLLGPATFHVVESALEDGEITADDLQHAADAARDTLAGEEHVHEDDDSADDDSAE